MKVSCDCYVYLLTYFPKACDCIFVVAGGCVVGFFVSLQCKGWTSHLYPVSHCLSLLFFSLNHTKCVLFLIIICGRVWSALFVLQCLFSVFHSLFLARLFLVPLLTHTTWRPLHSLEHTSTNIRFDPITPRANIKRNTWGLVRDCCLLVCVEGTCPRGLLSVCFCLRASGVWLLWVVFFCGDPDCIARLW